MKEREQADPAAPLRWPRVSVHVALIIVAFLALAGCGVSSDTRPFTAEQTPSVPPQLEHEARAIVAAFLERMADPEVTYRVRGELTIGSGEPPAAHVKTAYDVAGDDYGGFVQVSGSAVGEASAIDFQAIALDGTTHIWKSLVTWSSADSSESARVPNPFAALDASDLVFMGLTEDGLFDFEIMPWIGGDPVGEWVDVGAIEAEGLVPMSTESHRTRLTLDKDSIPHRVASSWTFVAGPEAIAGSASLTDEYSDFGLYVDIPTPAFGVPVETSYNLDVGVNADNTTLIEPFVEVVPHGDDTVELSIAFELPERPILLGIEGAIGFVRSHAPDGSVQLDTIISLDGDTVEVPIGEQTLLVYYRTCDGWCANLDAPTDYCAVAAEVAKGRSYELTVRVVDPERAVCTLDGLR